MTSHGWRNDTTREFAELMIGDQILMMETIERINHLASDLAIDQTIQEAANEAAASWYGQEVMPPRRHDIDWLQIGESFLLGTLDPPTPELP